VPRDRSGSFTPVIVPKSKRRLGQVEDVILSLYARGMSTRDICARLAEVCGATVSAATISRVTDVVVEEITAWQCLPVDAVYPIRGYPQRSEVAISTRFGSRSATRAWSPIRPLTSWSVSMAPNTYWACGFGSPANGGPRLR
jgi:hypothetical protein